MDAAPDTLPHLRDRVRALHDSPSHLHASHAIADVVRFVLMGIAIWALHERIWPVLPVVWAALAWMNLASLTRLHEAAHGTLVRTRWLNDAIGTSIGTFALTPLSVYRYMHHQHHAFVGAPADPEFWPYNVPTAPRALRLAYAWAELFAGWIVTPTLYSYRTLRSWPEVPARQRPRIIAEWALLVVVWGVLLGVIGYFRWWPEFIVAHFVSMWAAGSIQAIRKFTEHLGMFGEGVLGVTRTVVHERPLGKALSKSQLHTDHHGTHHRWARIPYYGLPEATKLAFEETPDGRMFPNYLAAMADMIPNLLDPKVGSQWVSGEGRPEAAA